MIKGFIVEKNYMTLLESNLVCLESTNQNLIFHNLMNTIDIMQETFDECTSDELKAYTISINIDNEYHVILKPIRNQDNFYCYELSLNGNTEVVCRCDLDEYISLNFQKEVKYYE